MVSAILSRLVILVFGLLYPAYASYKAVKTKNIKEYIRRDNKTSHGGSLKGFLFSLYLVFLTTQIQFLQDRQSELRAFTVKWMMYWIVFALFTAAETFSDVFLSWIPFYYEIKMVFVFWLLSPVTQGSSFLYKKFVHPQLLKREKEIDEAIAQARTRGYSTIMTLGHKGLTYATNVVVKTAIKGQSSLVERVRSYSVNDLRLQEDRRREDEIDARYIDDSDEEFDSDEYSESGVKFDLPTGTDLTQNLLQDNPGINLSPQFPNKTKDINLVHKLPQDCEYTNMTLTLSSVTSDHNDNLIENLSENQQYNKTLKLSQDKSDTDLTLKLLQNNIATTSAPTDKLSFNLTDTNTNQNIAYSKKGTEPIEKMHPVKSGTDIAKLLNIHMVGMHLIEEISPNKSGTWTDMAVKPEDAIMNGNVPANKSGIDMTKKLKDANMNEIVPENNSSTDFVPANKSGTDITEKLKDAEIYKISPANKSDTKMTEKQKDVNLILNVPANKSGTDITENLKDDHETLPTNNSSTGMTEKLKGAHNKIKTVINKSSSDLTEKLKGAHNKTETVPTKKSSTDVTEILKGASNKTETVPTNKLSSDVTEKLKGARNKTETVPTNKSSTEGTNSIKRKSGRKSGDNVTQKLPDKKKRLKLTEKKPPNKRGNCVTQKNHGKLTGSKLTKIAQEGNTDNRLLADNRELEERGMRREQRYEGKKESQRRKPLTRSHSDATEIRQHRAGKTLSGLSRLEEVEHENSYTSEKQDVEEVEAEEVERVEEEVIYYNPRTGGRYTTKEVKSDPYATLPRTRSRHRPRLNQY